MNPILNKYIHSSLNSLYKNFKDIRMLVTVLALVILYMPVNVGAAPRVIFTIDVESNKSFPLPQQVNSMCENHSACGLMEISRLLEAQGWPGTFFLNVYEHRRWGEATMREITENLLAAGQDVALHTHPQWAYDPDRWAMFQYSLDEQITIIRDGIKLLETWTGAPVVSHRAGAYTANQQTLEALVHNGIRIDSSLFWKHPWSQINELGLTRNLPSAWRQLTEIPVTVYQRNDYPLLFEELFSPVTSIRKIDPDWFLSKEEAIDAIDAIIEANFPFLVVFLHSYSFMNASKNSDIPLADQHSLDMFHVILNHIAIKRLPVVTMRDLAESNLLSVDSPTLDVIPQVTNHISFYRYIWYQVKNIERKMLTIISTIILLLILIGGIFLIKARRRRLTPNT